MPGFASNWGRKKGDDGKPGWGNLVRRPEPVKPQLEKATREISVLISRLDQAESRIRSRDEAIFRKVVAAIRNGDRDHATVYANELHEVRKIGTNVRASKLALEQVRLRLATIQDIGDVAATLAPTVAVVKGVSQGLEGLLPDAKGQLSEISTLLSSTLAEVGTVGETSLNFKAADEEAEKVLEEASAVAYRRMESEFPAVPAVVAGERDEDEALTA